MNTVKIAEKKENKFVNVFFKDDGISIIDLLESDFANFVNDFIKQNIK